MDSIRYILIILDRKVFEMCSYANILCHLLRPLCLINISMTGAYSGIQWNIYVKPFDIPPPPLSLPHPPLPAIHRANLGNREPK